MSTPENFATAFVSNVWEDGHAILMARLTDRPTVYRDEGDALQQADISSITLKAFDVDSGTPTTPITGFAGISLTVSSVIYDTLQGWHVDSIGHNFRYTIGPTAFATGDHETRVEITITRTDGTVGYLVYRLNVAPLVGS